MSYFGFAPDKVASAIVTVNFISALPAVRPTPP
jgi:hypothetical protein